LRDSMNLFQASEVKLTNLDVNRSWGIVSKYVKDNSKSNRLLTFSILHNFCAA